MDGVKGISFTPVLSALLMPTAKYLGSKLRDCVKETIEVRKSKTRDENVQFHIARNRPTFESYKHVLDDAETLTRFEKWIAGVEDVDFNNEELCILWDEVLSKIWLY
jgi:hypothetical protein